MKLKIWKTTYADKLFSLFIRARDGKCMRCHRTDLPLDCSHYWERGKTGTRFDPDNCIALCRDCHTAWDKKQNQAYKDFMLKRLGQERYDALERKARTMKKMWDAVVECMALLNEKSAEAP